ncbi:MAG: N-6 DNA methylase [Bauldia sp.]|nr:N-6 DNA methylase [Bauldia sp.]
MSAVIASSRAVSLSAHKPGRSLAMSVQTRQRPLIQARTLLIDALREHCQTEERFGRIFATRAPNQTTRLDIDAAPERAAWALINVYLLGAAAEADVRESLAAAETWFLGGRAGALPSLTQLLEPAVDRACVALLSDVAMDEEFRRLLPYVLEPYNFAHRLNAKRCADSRERRQQKRGSGTFYTPGDVADVVTSNAVPLVRGGGTALDPACGTGVFLLSLLRQLRAAGDPRTPLEICERALFGIDLSDLAVESCAFSLAHECLDSLEDLDPWVLWHRIRFNLWAHDTTLVDFSVSTAGLAMDSRRRSRNALSGSLVPEGSLSRGPLDRASLWREAGTSQAHCVFPEGAGGFDAVVSNPPYVKEAGAAGNVYLKFIEVMIQAANRRDGFLGAVLPLSIAFGSDADTRRVRYRLTQDAGLCRFAFFDREPHGLFGEEVKTRSALLFRSFGDVTGAARVQTTALIRLTSRTRAATLGAIPAVELGRAEIGNGVPKLGSRIEADAYRCIRGVLVAHSPLPLSSQSFEECLADQRDTCVYVGATAYNFINAARQLRPPRVLSHRPTQSSFAVVGAATKSDADSLFAVLSSRIVYWLWTVDGDGFHVSRRFVERVSTFWRALDTEARSELACLGAELWDALAAAPTISVNAGAWSLAFSPLRQQGAQTQIDRVLATGLGLPEYFVGFLEGATIERIIISPSEERRRLLVG